MIRWYQEIPSNLVRFFNSNILYGLNTHANRMTGKYYRNKKFLKSIIRVFSFHKYGENNWILSFFFICDAREIEKVRYKCVYISLRKFLVFCFVNAQRRGNE